MGYRTIEELLRISKGNGAVGAFNIHNLEFIKGVVKAAEEENKPAIMMINEAVLMYGGIEVLGGAAMAAAKNAKVDMGVMVDHGTNTEFLKKCIDFGLDVMIWTVQLYIQRKISEIQRKWLIMPTVGGAQ